MIASIIGYNSWVPSAGVIYHALKIELSIIRISEHVIEMAEVGARFSPISVEGAEIFDRDQILILRVIIKSIHQRGASLTLVFFVAQYNPAIHAFAYNIHANPESDSAERPWALVAIGRYASHYFIRYNLRVKNAAADEDPRFNLRWI